MFADGSRFNLYRDDSHAHVGGRLVDCCIQESDGDVVPSLMGWGAFNVSGKPELLVVDGTINQQCYIGILRHFFSLG